MHSSALTWPADNPGHGAVQLRAPRPEDVAMVMDLASDPYVPLIGSLPAYADEAQALDYLERQQRRLAEGAGFSFVIADTASDVALGGIGLWLRGRDDDRASVGYAVAPRARGRGVAASALIALTGFAWSFPDLVRLEAFIEPSNTPSLWTARAAGFEYEGLLRSYLVIGSRRRDMAVYSRVRDEAA